MGVAITDHQQRIIDSEATAFRLDPDELARLVALALFDGSQFRQALLSARFAMTYLPTEQDSTGSVQ